MTVIDTELPERLAGRQQAIESVRAVIRVRYPQAGSLLIDGMAWEISSGMQPETAPAVVTVEQSDPFDLIRITAGVAIDVPTTGVFFQLLNAENASLEYGRIFALVNAEAGMGAVLMQEIIPARLMTRDHAATTRYLDTLVQYIVGRSSLVGDRFVAKVGGRPFDPSSGMLLIQLG